MDDVKILPSFVFGDFTVDEPYTHRVFTFKVIDTDGVVYHFDTYDLFQTIYTFGEHSIPKTLTYPINWKLTKIEFPDQKGYIELFYNESNPIDNSISLYSDITSLPRYNNLRSVSATVSKSCSQLEVIYSLNFNSNHSDDLLVKNELSRISNNIDPTISGSGTVVDYLEYQFPQEQIFFRRAPDNKYRLDVTGSSNSFALDYIAIFLHGENTKNIKFFHSYFSGNKWLRLDSIDINASLEFLVNIDGQEAPVIGADYIPSESKESMYYFQYQNTPFSMGSFDIDHWGYYNGANNQSLLPEKDALEILNSKPGVNIGSNSFANREPDNSNNLAIGGVGLLQQIDIPNGMSYELNYEPHDYSKMGQSTIVDTPLILLEDSFDCATNCTETFFSNKATDLNITFQIHCPTCPSGFTYPIGADEFYIYVNGVEKYNTTTHAEGSFSVPINYGPQAISFVSQTNTDLILSLEYSYDNFDLSLGDKTFIRTAGGARVKSIEVKGPGIDRVVNYSYRLNDSPPRSSGNIYSRPNYFQNITNAAPNYVLPYTSAYCDGIVAWIAYSSATGAGSAYFDSHISYSRVERTETSNLTSETYRNITTFLTPNFSHIIADPMPIIIPMSYLFNSPKTIEVFNDEDVLVRRDSFVYNNFLNNNISTEALSVSRIANSLDLNNMEYIVNTQYLTQPVFNTSQHFSKEILCSGEYLETSKLYTYKENSNIVSEIETVSLGETQIVEFKYIGDGQFGPGPYSTIMPSKHMIGIPIETISSGVVESRFRRKFTSVENNTIVVPTGFEMWDYDTETWLPGTIEVMAFNSNGRPTALKRKGFDYPQEYISVAWNIYNKPESVNNSGRETQYHYNLKGLLSKVKAPDGQENIYKYDNFNRLMEIEVPDKNKTIYDYQLFINDEINQVGITPLFEGVQYDLSGFFVYDGLGQVTEVKENGYLHGFNIYDIFGRQVVTKGTSNSFGVTRSYINGPSNELLSEWIIGWNDVKSFCSAIENNMLRKSFTDENGNTSYQYYDAIGRLVKERKVLTDPNSAAPYFDILYHYDSRGNLIEVKVLNVLHGEVDPDDFEIAYQYAYDAYNRLIWKSVPLEGEYHYAYYDTDLLKYMVTPDGDTFEYVYNVYGEVVEEKINDITVVTNIYGETGHLTGKLISREVKMLSPIPSVSNGVFITYSFDYDNFGRLKEEVISHPWGSDIVNYYMDNADFLHKSERIHEYQPQNLSLTVVDSFIADQHLRLSSHLQSVDNKPFFHLTENEYNNIGQISKVHLGKGYTQTPLHTNTFRYNQRDWLRQINEVHNSCLLAAADNIYDSNIKINATITVSYNEAKLLQRAPTSIGYTLTFDLLDENDIVMSTLSFDHKLKLNGFKSEDVVYDGSIELFIDNIPSNKELAKIIANEINYQTPGIENLFIGDSQESQTLSVEAQTSSYFSRALSSSLCNELGDPLFGQRITYSFSNHTVPGGKPQYNGNIYQIEWNSFGRDEKDTYVFTYDEFDRLKGAVYIGNNLNQDEDLSVSISYRDFIGNIASLDRNGIIGFDNNTPQFGAMDSLEYQYSDGLLSYITEHKNQNFGYLGAGTGFGYENGKMTAAAGRGISNIVYNELRLPAQIQMADGVLEIFYDATGIKWMQRFAPTDQNLEEKVIVYINGLEYHNSALPIMHTPYGRAVFLDNDTVRYEFTIRDHLGNTRVQFSDLNGDGQISLDPQDKEVLQVLAYYPFGMTIEGLNPADLSDPAYRYRYNGKEEEPNSRMYDYGARWYMPDIGRWGVVDPLAEKAPGWTPYRYGFNNPIRFIDPDGMSEGENNLTEIFKHHNRLMERLNTKDKLLSGFNPQVNFNNETNLGNQGESKVASECEGCPSIYDHKNREVVTNECDGNDYILYNNQWHKLPSEKYIYKSYRDPSDHRLEVTVRKTREEVFIENFYLNLFYREGFSGVVGANNPFTGIALVYSLAARHPISLPLVYSRGIENIYNVSITIDENMKIWDSHVDEKRKQTKH
jgi:RHS repeat-associated protein